jgi:hypothetical protein
VYFSVGVCFFAAVNLAVWDGVPFELKWASYYLTGCVLLFRMMVGDWRRCADIGSP